MDRLRRARTWLQRIVVAFLMHTPYMPPSLLLVWLEWLHAEMDPSHPGMQTVLAEIAEVKERCYA